MNCYYHQNDAAVGTCNYCQKALCSACVKDLGFGIACEAHVQDLTKKNAQEAKIREQQARITNLYSGKAKYISPAFIGGLGIFNIIWYLILLQRGQSASLLLTLGIIFIIYAIVRVVVIKRIYHNKK